MDVELRTLAAHQYDVVAAWQLLAAGWTRHMFNHRVREHGWRAIHRGVYALNNAPLTRPQLWIAATLTSPDSVLSHASAGACFGFRPWEGSFETIARPGSGGRRRCGRLLVSRSTTLQGDTTRHAGIPITTAARTLLDLSPYLLSGATRRAFREALRLKVTSRDLLLGTVARHPGRPGARVLGGLAVRYGRLPYERTRSDAEGAALELLQDAGVQAPRVNVRIAGEEADLSWPEQRLIIEIDGPQYHRFPEEDARKQREWERHGYTVSRIGSELVYTQPAALIALTSR